MDMTEQLKRRLEETARERIKLTVQARRRDRWCFAAYMLAVVISNALIVAGYPAFGFGMLAGALCCWLGHMAALTWEVAETSRKWQRQEIERIEREGGLR